MNRRALAFLLTFFVPAAATAQSPDEADALFRSGVSALEEEQFAEAEESFRRSYASRPAAATACNLALTYDRWGNHRDEAIAAYERCAENDTEGRFRRHALERAQALRSELAADVFVFPESGPAADVTSSESSSPSREPPPLPTTQTSSGRRHPLLWAGLVSLAAGGGMLAGGAVAAGRGRDDLAAIDERNIDPSDTDSVALYRSADQRRTTALALYIGAAGLGALGMLLIGLDIAAGHIESPRVGVAPLRGGGLVSARLSLR